AADTPVAAIARGEERKRNAIAFFQRPAERIGRHALAETVHDAGELVTGHAAHVRTRVVAVVAPVVQIGAADGGGSVLDEDASRLHFWSRQGLELERLARLVEYDGQSLWHRSVLLGCASSRQHPNAKV